MKWPLLKSSKRKQKSSKAVSPDVSSKPKKVNNGSSKPQPAQKKDGSCSVVALVLGGGSYNEQGILQMALKTLSSTTATQRTTKKAVQWLRHSSSFLRVADLNLDANSSLDDISIDSVATGDTEASSLANFHHAAADPPPGVDHDPRERWIALDDGAGSHAPIAPFAVQALAKTGLHTALDEDMWTQHTSSRYFKQAPWHALTFPSGGHSWIPNEELPGPDDKHADMVLLWTGKFQHGHYGSELPAVRAIGIIPAPPKELFDMLHDSTRVKEYNKMSLGREDLLVLQDSLHEVGPFGKSVTKVMRSKSSPPLVSKPMELISMLHAQELEDESGYLIVTRAVTHPDSYQQDSSVLRSEILLGVNVIKRIRGDPNRCIMINMIHMRSPMVPMVIANRIGASAASGFIKDLQKAAEDL